jgi:hypothetical protein
MFKAALAKKAISVCIVTAFFLAAGLSISMGMTMEMNGMMSDCPFMLDNGSICSMSLLAHIGEWRQLTTALPLISFATLIFVLFAYVVFSYLREIRPPLFLNINTKKDGELIAVFSPLFHAFSRGILNSRLFV